MLLDAQALGCLVALIEECLLLMAGVNLLSELDADGEYYLDAVTSLLHFCPPGGDVTVSEAVVSIGQSIVSASTSTADALTGDAPLAHAANVLMGRSAVVDPQSFDGDEFSTEWARRRQLAVPEGTRWFTGEGRGKLYSEAASPGFSWRLAMPPVPREMCCCACRLLARGVDR